ncbi:hypothetical protein Scep_012048 [Stephania cephalantha]|uniref:Uncharacterized protein n=1 Tax=Stephania cephalantha TaxID=152367 RepID=A0AAP0P907_9MAGN
MLGISYGELFLIIGATAALIGPKDLPIIARTAGRLAGKAIGYIQLGRGQIQSVMDQSQVNPVHKELKENMAQLQAILHEFRSASSMYPTPMARTLMDNQEIPSASGGSREAGHQTLDESRSPNSNISKESSSATSIAANFLSQSAAYARIADSIREKPPNNGDMVKSDVEMGLLAVLPISADSAGLLPCPKGNAYNGSDIMLEAVLESDVAENAKQFFVQQQNQIKCE